MQPGTFAVLNTVGLTEAFLAPGGTGNDIFQFADNASWDPTSRQFLFQGMSHTSPIWKFIAYRESDNTWRYITPDPALQGITVAHAYDHNTLDPATGTQFHRLYNSPLIYTYDISTGTYGKLSIPMSNWQVSGGLEWFPERNGLVFVDGDWGIWFYNKGKNTWSLVANTNAIENASLPKFTMGHTSAIAKYNPVNHVVLLGGGGTPSIYAMDAKGAIKARTSAPFGLAPSESKVAVDPVSGLYLVCGASQVMWTYDVSADKWTNTGINVPFTCEGSTIEASISTYGVVMYVTHSTNDSKVYLFKYGPRVQEASPSEGGQAPNAPAPAREVRPKVIQPAPAVPPVSETHATGQEPRQLGRTDFQARCKAPGVVLCNGFDTEEDIKGAYGNPKGIFPGNTSVPTIDPEVKASGMGSLRFTIPEHASADAAGAFFTNFSDDLSTQFGPGQEFFIQWRQRFSPEFVNTKFAGGEGWKQAIIGEGDRPGFLASSCTQLEIVLQNGFYQGAPRMYHSCGEKDGRYDPLEYYSDPLGGVVVQNGVGCVSPQYSSPPCVKYSANEWMTFQVHVKIGSWYTNNGSYRHDSAIQLWVAHEGKPSKLVIDFSSRSAHGYDIANTNPAAKYGKIWLLPYNTGKDPSVAYPVAYTWYDELIISRAKIADPK